MTGRTQSPYFASRTQVAGLDDGVFVYRGYPAHELAEQTRFEEVAHLLIYGHLPTRRELSQLHDTLMEYRRLTRQLRDAIRLIPTDVPPMGVLRTLIAVAGHYDPVRDGQADNLRRRSVWLLSTIASLVTARHRHVARHRAVDPRPGLSHAAQILYQCQEREPDEAAVRLLDTALILMADNAIDAPCLAVRTVNASRSDLVSGVVAGTAAAKGVAGADLLDGFRRIASADEAPRIVSAALANGETLAGLTRNAGDDRRIATLEQTTREYAEHAGRSATLAIYDAAIKAVADQADLHPTLAFCFALALEMLDLPAASHGPIFVAARVAGWCAHFIEQSATEPPLALHSTYAGPPRRGIPRLSDR